MTSTSPVASTQYDYHDATVSRLPKTITTDPTRLAPPDAVSASQTTPRANGGIGKEGRRKLKRGGSKRQKGPWKKLLWVKQSFPDNYTDEATFLDHMQRNPQFQQYEFWTLVGSSTVIVQHVCSVTIFVCCFAGIVQERLSPVVVASTGSLATVLGWALWDYWVTRAEEDVVDCDEDDATNAGVRSDKAGGADRLSNEAKDIRPKRSGSTASLDMVSTRDSSPAKDDISFNEQPAFAFSARNQRRLATGKSAILIYCALLGLSPILKSLTQSTTSDSIWAISAWLMIINVFFFDYSSSPSAAAYTASLSTNAAIMASTVLASRLTSTTHVFSLMLFSIEVFGLFPIFRRYLAHVAWRAHTVLTVGLVLAAWAGLAVTVTGGGWTTAIVGAVMGSIAMGILMATCAFWLIGMQKYKNEIYGPWDPARPVIRRRWD